MKDWASKRGLPGRKYPLDFDRHRRGASCLVGSTRQDPNLTWDESIVGGVPAFDENTKAEVEQLSQQDWSSIKSLSSVVKECVRFACVFTAAVKIMDSLFYLLLSNPINRLNVSNGTGVNYSTGAISKKKIMLLMVVCDVTKKQSPGMLCLKPLSSQLPINLITQKTANQQRVLGVL